MGQRKGQTGNPNGRPKGTPNKVSSETKEKIQMFIEANIEKIQQDFDSVDAKDRLIIFERLLKYVIPTKAEQENIIDDVRCGGINITIPGINTEITDE